MGKVEGGVCRTEGGRGLRKKYFIGRVDMFDGREPGGN